MLDNLKNHLKSHPEYLWLAAILIISTLLRLAFLHEPFERDEGQYASIAQVILRGGVPYRDAIEIKPPGAFYLYALGIALFGASTEAVRIFTALYSVLTVIAVFGVARLLSGARGGLLAALLYGIFSTGPMLQGSSSNTEVFLVLPLTAGVWCLLAWEKSGRRWGLCGAGLCAALAMLIKPVALPLVALQFLAIPFLRQERSLHATARDLAAFLLPVALLALGTIGYFKLAGALDDFLYWTVEFPRHYRDSEAQGPALSFVLRYLTPTLLVPVLAGLPGALWLLYSSRGVKRALPLLFILGSCLAIALPGKYFPHYFNIIVPFLAITGGCGLAGLGRLPRLWASLAYLPVAAAFAYAVWANYPFYAVYQPDTVSAKKYGTPIFADSVKVARYLQERTRPGDYIFQWGLEPELYFLADRRCPNPYLVSLLPSWSKDPQRATDRMMRSLFENPPAYIVTQPEWADYPGKNELYAYISMRCREEVDVDYLQLYHCSSK